MKRTKKTTPANPLQGMRMTGRITWHNQPCEIWMNKAGEIHFVLENKVVEDPGLQDALMAYLLEANKESS